MTPLMKAGVIFKSNVIATMRSFFILQIKIWWISLKIDLLPNHLGYSGAYNCETQWKFEYQHFMEFVKDVYIVDALNALDLENMSIIKLKISTWTAT